LSRASYKSSQIQHIIQDRNREFITLIACISVVNITILSTLLYKSGSSDLQDTWLDNISIEQEAFFGGSANR